MKLNKISTAAIAVAIASILGTAAHAQTAGDLIIGFEQSGNDNVYEVDLGSASNFISPTSPTETFNLSGTDLSTYFGSTWATVTTNAGPPATNAVQWGIVGGTGANVTLTSGVLQKNTVFTSWNTWDAAPSEKSTNGQNTTALDVTNLYSDVKNGGTPTTGSTLANPAIVTSASGDGNSFYDSINSSSTPNFNFGAGFTKSPLDSNQDSSLPGADALTLDLYELTPTNASITKPTALLGTFTLASNGTLTFTEASVPEPSTYLLMGLGGVVLLWRLRRNADHTA